MSFPLQYEWLWRGSCCGAVFCFCCPYSGSSARCGSDGLGGLVAGTVAGAMSRHEARSPLYLHVDALSNLQENTGGSFMIIRRDVQRREHTVLLRNHVGEELGVLVWPFDAQLTVESVGSVVRGSASALHEFGSGSGEVSGPRDLGRSWGTETLRDWGSTCKVRILDGRRIQLREEPRSRSLPGEVTFGEGDPIEAIGWDVVNGYMHVRAGIEGCLLYALGV